MDLKQYPDLILKIDQIKEGRKMMETSIEGATSEVFEATKTFKTYWELYAFVKLVSTSTKEFNIQMQKARESFLRR